MWFDSRKQVTCRILIAKYKYILMILAQVSLCIPHHLKRVKICFLFNLTLNSVILTFNLVFNALKSYFRL